MGMSATQARYLALIGQQSDLEFQGQQINESRTTLSQQTNNLYSQLQDLTVPTPPHTTDYTTIKYTGSLGADNFNIGKVVPSGSTYSVNLEYNKAGNSTYSVGKAQVTETPAKIYINKVADTQTLTNTVAKTTLINSNVEPTEVKDKKILRNITTKEGLTGALYVRENNQLVKKDLNAIPDDAFANGLVYEQTTAKLDENGKPANFVPGKDFLFDGEYSEDVTPTVADFSSYYIKNSDGSIRHALAADFNYNNTTKRYEFKSDVEYYKAGTSGEYVDNPDHKEGIGKSLAGNPLLECKAGLTKYKTETEIESAIEALRNGFPEYANYSDDDLLDLFYVSFSDEGSMKVPHFVLKTDLESPVDGAQSKWAEYHDITTTGTYTKTETYKNCDLTFDTSGRITEIAIPIVNDKGETVYQKVKLTASSVTDEQAYGEAYNDYEYEKFEYDKAQQKINGQMSIIQQEDKKLELKLQRLDNERTQITTEIEALKKVINDNIEASYKTFSG